jgi:hypothetical protein
VLLGSVVELLPQQQARNISSPVITELGRQLGLWRISLPSSIQWCNDEKLFTTGYERQGGCSCGKPDIGEDLSSVFGGKVERMMAATLRSRFYYARFMTYRPVIYKAMHFPDLLSEIDLEQCVLAVRSACMWPLLSWPSKDMKRLVPHLFTWTQSFMSILILFAYTRESSTMRQICEKYMDLSDLNETTILMIAWLKDMALLDGVADWAGKIQPCLL